MMSSFNRLFGISARIVAIAIVACSVEAATIHFQSNGNMLKQSQLTIDGNFLGIIGDFVDLQDGVYRISLDAPREYRLQFTLLINGNTLKVESTQHTPGDCAERFKINWPRPTVADSGQYQDVKVIVLSDPEFGRSTGHPDRCSMGGMAGCLERKIIMKVESEPSGAEIWIGEKKMPFLTNTTLSVPYCEDESSKEIMFRMDRKINCKQTIQLSPDAKVLVACKFSEPDPIN